MPDIDIEHQNPINNPSLSHIDPTDSDIKILPNELIDPNEQAVKPAAKLYALDLVKPISPHSFPNKPSRPGGQVPATGANVKYLLNYYGIHARYNTINKKLELNLPGHSGCPDNYDNSALTQILSLATLNGISTGQIGSIVAMIGDQNQRNPVAEWIQSKPWDGVDRLGVFYATLVQRENFPEALKQTLLYKWMLSAVAAGYMPSGFHSRGVLTLQGAQSIGKTAWMNALIPDAGLNQAVLKLGHTLDPSSKDSVTGAITHWIVEFGELEGTLKKDLPRLKAFVSAAGDKFRLPYARAESEFPRRTVFCATVNDANFLVDSTGNTRWWTIPVKEINFRHGIDMQQLFAQLAEDFEQGANWRLTKEEEQELEVHNQSHRTVSALRERILGALDLDRAGSPKLPAMTAIQVLASIGIQHPANAQCRECGAILRELLGPPKESKGSNKWRVPLREQPNMLHHDFEVDSSAIEDPAY